MPGIWKRVSRIVRANLNELLDRAEDPEVMIEQILEDMKANYQHVREQVASAIAQEKRLKKQADEHAALAQKWVQKAELALDSGEEELAREAIRRKQVHQNQAETFHDQWEVQAQAVGDLKEELQQLEQKISEAQAKKDSLIARSRVAKAQKQIHDTLGRMDTSEAFSSFDRLEDKVESAEARAEAAKDLSGQTLEDRFAELEKKDSVESELESLKARRQKKQESGS